MEEGRPNAARVQTKDFRDGKGGEPLTAHVTSDGVVYLCAECADARQAVINVAIVVLGPESGTRAQHQFHDEKRLTLIDRLNAQRTHEETHFAKSAA